MKSIAIHDTHDYQRYLKDNTWPIWITPQVTLPLAMEVMSVFEELAGRSEEIIIARISISSPEERILMAK